MSEGQGLMTLAGEGRVLIIQNVWVQSYVVQEL